MTRKHRFKKPNPAIETGKTLPNRITSYSPSHRHTAVSESDAELKPPKRLWRKALLFLLLLIFGGVLFIGVWDARNISSASTKLFGDSNIFTLLRGGGLSAADNGRVNILIAGYSADDPGHAGANLTDSIILLSMDPAAKAGFMLSIPRDLYVNIPGFGYAKINEAYDDGGISLLKRVVSRDFGIQINNYALINYAAVRQIVDALGGVSININSPDGRLYDPNKDWTTGGPLVDLSNGQHLLGGQEALDLTRARGDPTSYGVPIGFEQSDFQRTADQRLVFTAIKDEMNWKLVLDPRQNGKILNAVADNVKTDVTASEARPLFGLFNSIPSSKLKSLSLRDFNGTNYLSSYTTVYGQSALIPAAGIDDYSQIQNGLDSIIQ